MDTKFNECCGLLESSKITSRRTGCDELNEILHDRANIRYLLADGSMWWKKLLSSLQISMLKDADKRFDEIKKKGTMQGRNSTPRSGDIFFSFTRIAVKEGAQINTKRLFTFIFESFSKDSLRSAFGHIFLKTLSQCLLTCPHTRSKLTPQQWDDLLKLVKSSIDFKALEVEQVKCITTILKLGPLSNLPVDTFRQQFGFIAKINNNISATSPMHLLEAVLELVQEFTKNAAKDNRMACCKLGESVFNNLIQILQTNYKIKPQLLDFFLLQLAIHHPNGANRNHPAAYAFNWVHWQSNLEEIYYILVKDIKQSFESVLRNQWLFINDGQLVNLLENFAAVFVEVVKQLFYNRLDNNRNESDDEVPLKRQKIENCVDDLIAEIKQTKFWAWISLTSSILSEHSEIFTETQFNIFLDVLINIFDEKEANLRYHIYKALIVTKHHETKFNLNQSYYEKVADLTLRAIDSDDNEAQLHELLQILMKNSHIKFDRFLQAFKAMKLSEFSLETVKVAFDTFPQLQSNNSFKIAVINWILCENSTVNKRLYSNRKVATILVNLVLNQWPNQTEVADIQVISKRYSDIEEIYCKTSFDGLLIKNRDTNRGAELITTDYYNHNLDLFNNLIASLKDLVKKCDFVHIKVDEFLSICVLLININSLLLNYEIIKGDNIEEFALYKLFLLVIKFVFDDLNFDITQEGRNLLKIVDTAAIFTLLFENHINSRIAVMVRQVIPRECLTKIFKAIADEKVQTEEVGSLKIALLKLLLNFSYFPLDVEKSKTQRQAIDALLSYDYDSSSEIGFKLSLILVSFTKSALTDAKTMDCINLYNIVCGSYNARSDSYFCSLQIIQMIYDLIPIFSKSASDKLQTDLISILLKFCEHHLEYGPQVAVSIINCIQAIFECESSGTCWHKFGEELNFKVLPEFLTSHYQEVRFAAIEILSKYFEKTSASQLLTDYHKQEIMFSKILEMSAKVFQIEANADEDRKVDETVTRTSSVLHTFAAIMISSNLWIEEALFALTKITRERFLSYSSVHKIIYLVSMRLNYESSDKFLEKYLVVLFKRWSEISQNFPHEICLCGSKEEFYNKYFQLLAPMIVESQSNQSVIEIVANFRGITVSQLLEASAVRLLSYAIAKSRDCILEDQAFILLRKHFSSNKIRELLKENMDEIILNLCEFFKDKADFKSKFSISTIFPSFHDISLSINDFHDSLIFIEGTLDLGDNVMVYFLGNSSEKIPNLLLKLKLSIFNAKFTQEKFRCFHVYTVVLLMLIEDVLHEKKMQLYLIRDTIYSLLHFIKQDQDLSEISCRFMKTCLEKILPGLTEALQPFFIMLVSRLKIISLQNSSLRQFALEMLQFLIVENSAAFCSEIKKLDSFPDSPEFAHISEITRRGELPLNREIEQFVEFAKSVGNFEECQYGLEQISRLISTKKGELKELFQDLRSSRRFSEDCDKSILHQLICILVKISRSSNEIVRNEAIRCLGEIGPSNVSTLVLQPEKPIPDTKWSPFELFCGHIISLMVDYIVDPDINVKISASELLFRLLETKEGRKVALSGEDFGYGPIKTEFLSPFLPKATPRNNYNLKINFTKLSLNSCSSVWVPSDFDHKKWITNLVRTLLETTEDADLFNAFAKLAEIKTEFSEQLLPLLVFIFICTSAENVKDLISKRICEFFNNHWEITVNKSPPDLSKINKSSVQCMLNTISFVRLQNVTFKKQLIELRVDYFKIAKAAQFCTAHFTALLYVELWCQELIKNSPRDFTESYSYTKLDLIYEKADQIAGNELQNILRSGYAAIGESDALFGCGTSHLLNPSTRVEHYKQLRRWDQVINRYDSEAAFSPDSIQPLIQSFKDSNLLYTSSRFSELVQPDYECLWRLGQWDHPIASQESNQNNLERFKFGALKAIQKHDDHAFKINLIMLRNTIAQDLQEVNLESCKNLYTVLTQVQALTEIEEFANSLKTNTTIDLIDKWRSKDEITENDFQYLEPINAQRIVLLTNYSNRHDENVKRKSVELMLNFADYSRIEGRYNITSQTLENLRRICDNRNDFAKIQIQDANLCWAIQDSISAKCILRQLYNDRETNPKLRALALKLTGKYYVEESSQNRQTIIDEYFLKSIQILSGAKDLETHDLNSIVDTYNLLAKFADRAYQQVMSHIKSESFQKKKKNVEKSMQTVSQMNSSSSSARKISREFNKAIMIKQKFISIDRNEICAIESEKDKLLILALEYYLKTLALSDLYNINVFRVISLFLENRGNQKIARLLEEELVKISSYKFIDILPQMIPHIFSSNHDIFTETVNIIIEKCAEEHPHHTLPLILALAFSEKECQDDRTKCAKSILVRLEKKANLKPLIKKMEKVSEALIELAYTDAKSDREKVPRNSLIRNIKNFDDVLVPTIYLAVRKDRVYDNIIGISHWEETYTGVGGINCPKRVTCIGTDGLKRSQLVKGKDDLRQDAVMQQVFTIINNLLAVNKNTKELLIRTYKVVPLSMRSGILEWVPNSMPISDYLVGSDNRIGAHEKYRPMDRSPKRCRSDFAKLAHKGNDEKLSIFKSICKEIQPVFHNFFVATFPQPTVWYERRRAYTRSVATSSMCGYILGIGDRHLSNMLIDMKTAEVIHIDFGIAFEQGRCLPTPETVPFRLTRDVVDGFGVSGIEGVFRKSCEKTMELLRSHQETIITILEVLLYDPLYDWIVSSAEANKRQNYDDDSVVVTSESPDDNSHIVDINVTAERALLRLRTKLQGTEDGQSVSVEHQVGTLIQQAIDPFNLCRLFNGWQPYL